MILGDRTGEAEPGIYEQIWADAAGTKPAFVLTTGDTIQGLNDTTAEAEWTAAVKIFAPYRRYALHILRREITISGPRLRRRFFRRYSGHPPHYSFDYGPAHFTILDNSRSDQLSAEELDVPRRRPERSPVAKAEGFVVFAPAIPFRF